MHSISFDVQKNLLTLKNLSENRNIKAKINKLFNLISFLI